MTEICNYKECTGCSACANICAHKAIRMLEDHEGFLRPAIDKDLCVDCGVCQRVCPINHTVKNEIRSTIICASKDKETVLTSSSGGVFTEVCKAWSSGKESYRIYGAAFIKGKVIHVGVDDLKEAYIFKGSKYVQSDVHSVFPEIKEALKNGTSVLFSGTPCQVAGLRAYLVKDYQNLFCVDLVCHGVPSPKVYENYRKYLENKYKSEIISFNFVKKYNGWINKQISVLFKNNKTYQNLSITFDDPYMTLFLKHYVLRPSCELCHFTDISRTGDITLADAWGVEKLHPEFDYIDGASMVMSSTVKGEVFLTSLKKNLNYIDEDVRRYLIYNPQLAHPVKFAKDRDKVICKAVSENEHQELFQKGVDTRSFIKRLLSKIKWAVFYKVNKLKYR